MQRNGAGSCPIGRATNRVGYTHLGRGQIDLAKRVFEANLKAFPNSANAHGSLAELYMRGGELDRAIQLYQRALTLDPDDPVGENAARMLQRVQAQKKASELPD